MTELFINKARACAVTGHRRVEKDLDLIKLEKIFIKLIEGGFDTFLVGMAIGFDTICFKILEKLRRFYDIKIIACIPCKTQSYKYSKEQKEEYDKMVKSADERVILSENYTPYCMHQRNRYMVDNCYCLIAYLRQDFGGTANTVRYAQKQGVNIIFVK